MNKIPIVLKDFLMWTIFKVYTQFVTILLQLYVFSLVLRHVGFCLPDQENYTFSALEGKVLTTGPPENSKNINIKRQTTHLTIVSE